MASLSVNETTTFRWSFEEDVLNYAAAKIPSIGVWRHKLSDFGETKGVELLTETGLRVSHLFWAGGFTGSDGRTYRAGLDDAKEALQTAAEIRAGCLIVHSGSRAGHTHNHARRLFREALAELADLAAELKIDLAVEPMHPACAADFTFLTSLDDALSMLDAVNRPEVKLVLDTYQLGFTADLPERIPDVVDRIALVQLGDAKKPPVGEQNRCRLGEGILPLQAIVDALKTAGYRGAYDVELMGEDVENEDYRVLLTHAQEAYARLVGNGDS